MRTLMIVAAGALAALAAACTHPTDSSAASSFGEALRTMQTAQTVPGEVSTAPPEGSGAQGAAAQTRYKAGQTTPLLAPNDSVMNPSSANR